MSTLYELFKVAEDATQEEIESAYKKILHKASSLPPSDKLTEKVRRMQIAYGILSNPEKRKKYDMDLATKRADELLQNVQTEKEPLPRKKEVSEKNVVAQEKIPQVDEQQIQKAIDEEINSMKKTLTARELKERADRQRSEKKLHQEEQMLREMKQKKEQERNDKKQERKHQRQVRKERELKQEMEMQAYGEFLQAQGYHVKYPWTWRRVKRLLINLAIMVVVLVILWHIPFVHNRLVDLYNNNFVIKAVVDIFISLFQAIISIFR